MSSGVTQLRIGLTGFSRSSSASLIAGRQTWLYEWTTMRLRSCIIRPALPKIASRSSANGTRSERTT